MTVRLSGYWLLLGLAVAGCSSQQRERPPLTETFTTDITADGSKMFYYQLAMERPEGRRDRGDGKRPPRGGGERGDRDSGASSTSGQRGNSSRANEMEQMLEQNLNAKLEQTGYCREGYLELDRDLSRERLAIRGECREGATEIDRETYTETAVN